MAAVRMMRGFSPVYVAPQRYVKTLDTARPFIRTKERVYGHPSSHSDDSMVSSGSRDEHASLKVLFVIGADRRKGKVKRSQGRRGARGGEYRAYGSYTMQLHTAYISRFKTM